MAPYATLSATVLSTSVATVDHFLGEAVDSLAGDRADEYSSGAASALAGLEAQDPVAAAA